MLPLVSSPPPPISERLVPTLRVALAPTRSISTNAYTTQLTSPLTRNNV